MSIHAGSMIYVAWYFQSAKELSCFDKGNLQFAGKETTSNDKKLLASDMTSLLLSDNGPHTSPRTPCNS
jgi:hypothetical protein